MTPLIRRLKKELRDETVPNMFRNKIKHTITKLTNEHELNQMAIEYLKERQQYENTKQACTT